MKHLIFDSGPLINFSMNNLLYILEKLKREFNGEFIITKEVKKEIIDHPLTIKRFKLGALRLQSMFKGGTIKHADITQKQINKLRVQRNKLMQIANTTFKARGKPVHLIDKGEAAALALSQMLNNAPLVIDERTTRMLCENPDKLKKYMEKKLHTTIRSNEKNYEYFQNFKIIRSTELVYIAHKKGLFDLKNPEVLGAALYGLKFKGCSISEQEIEEMIKSK